MRAFYENLIDTLSRIHAVSILLTLTAQTKRELIAEVVRRSHGTPRGTVSSAERSYGQRVPYQLGVASKAQGRTRPQWI